MNLIKLIINNQEIEVPAGTSVLEAARMADIYIPSLCSHPDLPAAEEIESVDIIWQGERKIENAMPKERGKSCGLCLVEIDGENDLARSCVTEAKEGMIVVSENDRIRQQRLQNLAPILARHSHACLICDQQEGCSRSQCSFNVPEEERCCPKFGYCELQDIVNYIGILPSTPKWLPTDFPTLDNHLFISNYNLCICCTRCVRVCRDLRGIEAIGFVYDQNGNVQVGSITHNLEDSGCKFCTACVEVCPTGALMDKSVRRGREKEDIVPCKDACPVHIDIPDYLRLIAEGRSDEANAVIREKVPFPGILGRVCGHPCEDVCRRGELNEPVSICALKRYAADRDQGLWKDNSSKFTETGRKVAVIGAGPAGLTAAFYLRKKGYGVTVFDARNMAGGMMRYGIPRHRLPEALIDKEIKEIFDLGVEFKSEKILGKDFTINQLKKDGYEAFYLSVGSQLSRRIVFEGSDLPGVLLGIDFLIKVAEGEEVKLKENIIVIGGGNMAVDVAMTAMRCGARNVKIVCLEKREEMNACDREIERAVEEGVEIIPSFAPHRVLNINGTIVGMELVECTSVQFRMGKFCPSFGDKMISIEGDQVILAAGQVPDLSFIGEDSLISVNGGFIAVDEDTLETEMKGVYSGGDVTGLSGSVISAIAAGRTAASSIDKFLGGTGDIDEVLFSRGIPNQYIGRDEGFASWNVEKVAELDPESRHKSFKEIDLGFNDQQAFNEAKRCLQCDLRLFLSSNPSPPKKIMAFNKENISAVPEEEGVFQLYDQEKNVIIIKGSANLRSAMTEALDEYEKAIWFDFEENKMYSMRESELIQKYVRVHAKMPCDGSTEMDDLF